MMTLRDTNGDELITSGLMQSSYEITLTETAPAVMAVQCSSRAFAAGVVQENVNPLIVQPGDLVHFATPRGDNELRTLMGAESTLPECPMQGPPNLHDGDRVFGKPTLTGRILPDNGNERRVYLNFLLNGQKFSHVLTFAGSEGSFQNAHWHKGFEEVYKVVKGTMIFVELCPETLRYTFRTYGPGEVVQSRPGVPHNVYLNGGAIIWTGKVLIEPVENDWT
ncbi:MAG: cupin domain-containing protein, partial [Candidatus Magasanikbacteria bacterium]|nr:cupin domain-containing protein [Candidatus Magasanikbacteria bacterium]